MGIDILDVVQTGCKGMCIEDLARQWGDSITFSGTMDVQFLLTSGTPEDVEETVRERLRLFRDGGLVLGPAHSFTAGTPAENIIALYRTAGSLTQNA
jgi:uroporphyrinogen-III decarboxylase